MINISNQFLIFIEGSITQHILHISFKILNLSEIRLVTIEMKVAKRETSDRSGNSCGRFKL